MKKVLITGGCGFIGSAVLSELAERTDLSITVLDNYGMSPLPVLEYPLFTQFVEGDVRDRVLVAQLVRKHDVIVHLAAIVGTPACAIDHKSSAEINIGGTINILSYISNQTVIFTSTTDVYGKQPNNTRVDESTNIFPAVSYALHKGAGEAIIKSAINKYIILRPSTTFGTSQQVRVDTLLNTFITNALVNKKIELYQPDVQVTFNHVQDVARSIVHSIDEHVPYGIYNVANPALSMSKGDAAAMIAYLTEAEVVTSYGSDVTGRNFRVSSDKLLDTGFLFHYGSFKTGVEQLKEHLTVLTRNPDYFTTSYWVNEQLRRK